MDGTKQEFGGGGGLNFENWKDNISKSGLDRS